MGSNTKLRNNNYQVIIYVTISLQYNREVTHLNTDILIVNYLFKENEISN